jgi:hypothetical protein
VTEETKHNSKYLFLGKHLKLNGPGGRKVVPRTQVRVHTRTYMHTVEVPEKKRGLQRNAAFLRLQFVLRLHSGVFVC